MKENTKIKDIIGSIENIAPPFLQESYDNAGLIIGNTEMICKGIILALDCTWEILQIAIKEKKNLIITHHPLIFKGIKKLSAQTEVEQTICLAIKNDIAIYAAHTNLDNTLRYGVNKILAEKIGLSHIQPLLPKAQLLEKIQVFVPHDYIQKVYQAMSDAGAGHIGNYDSCSFQSQGTGTFRALQDAKPFIGELNTLHQALETKIEMIYPMWQRSKIIQAMLQSHPYEQVAYDILTLQNTMDDYGSGAVGTLKEEMDEIAFLKLLKKTCNLSVIKHSTLRGNNIRTVALCGGAGVFLLPQAIQKKADIFITSDIKYHDFFLPERKLVLADIGHWESEQFTIEIFYKHIINNFPKFASHIIKCETNPIQYFL